MTIKTTSQEMIMRDLHRLRGDLVESSQGWSP
jgi:hypothetical protein